MEQEVEIMDKGREPHPSTPQTMPRSRQREPLQQTIASSDPESGNPEEGTLLKANHIETREPAHSTAPTNQLYTGKKQS
jgi:hypothetical protein